LQIWEHISEHTCRPHLSATAIGKLFSPIKLVMRTPALEILNIVLWNKGCCRSDENLSLGVLVNICHFIWASPWWAQL